MKQIFIEGDRVDHIDFRNNRREADDRVLLWVFKEILRKPSYLLEFRRLQFQPSHCLGWLAFRLARVMKKLLRCHSERMNRSRVSLMKPEQDCTFQLTPRRLLARNSYYPRLWRRYGHLFRQWFRFRFRPLRYSASRLSISAFGVSITRLVRARKRSN